MEAPGKGLVERARQKDAEAFAALIRSYERVALSVAYGVVGESSAAGDVVQEAFVRAWQRLADLREPQRFGTWLCGIVRNLAVDHLRRRKPAEPLEAAALGSSRSRTGAASSHQCAQDERWTHDPMADMDRRERNARIAAAIASLDETSRPVVVLRYYENLSSRQIGELLEISAAAVDMRLSRARRQLRVLLDELMEGQTKS